MTVIDPIHLTTDALDGNLHRALPSGDHGRVRGHLDQCEPCWQQWNRHRWDAARPHPLYAQLVEFLGPKFQPYFDSSRALAAEWDAANPRTADEVAQFFRTSTSYLYNLAIWEASGNRPDYVAEAQEALTRHGARTILDYGCGIGSDTIPLHHRGFHVSGCDFRSPSTTFLARRCSSIPVTEPGSLDSIATPDTLWIIDTIDHLEDIETSIGTLLSTVNLMITENPALNRGHGRQRFHHRRPFTHLAAVFACHGLTLVASPTSLVAVWRRKVTTAAEAGASINKAMAATTHGIGPTGPPSTQAPAACCNDRVTGP